MISQLGNGKCDMHVENFNLIELADHKLKKKDLEESLMYIYNMGLCYDSHTRGSFWNHDNLILVLDSVCPSIQFRYYST
ncbi:MAG: hypothetical protein CM15mV25_1000 [uncultured marine virus]|nr:MAG: hypothetical protein CM15mV25_1000 [uncultured marine virus]